MQFSRQLCDIALQYLSDMMIEDDLRATFYSPMDVETYCLLGLDKPGPRVVNGHSQADIETSLHRAGDAQYRPCNEAFPDDSVPKGGIHAIDHWECNQYPNTSRRIWVYVPAKPPPDNNGYGLILFNDGQIYLDKNDAVRATYVLDSLHAQESIPPTVGIFATPGMPTDINPNHSAWTEIEWEKAAEHRSIEYDSLKPDYGQFLCEELLPFIENALEIRLTDDPTKRVCCGASSGGIAAFTCAWHFPNKFARVLSHVGSFANIKGGHNYPWLVRSTPRKDIRVCLQSGENDAATIFGDWALANKTMANALEFAGYDYRFDFGTGGHTLAHGGAVFADSIRWLLR